MKVLKLLITRINQLRIIKELKITEHYTVSQAEKYILLK